LLWLEVAVTWAPHLVEEPAEATRSFYKAYRWRLAFPEIDGATAIIDLLHIMTKTVLPTLAKGAQFGRSIKPTSVANQGRRKTFRKG